jgi:hypothetical protein
MFSQSLVLAEKYVYECVQKVKAVTMKFNQFVIIHSGSHRNNETSGRTSAQKIERWKIIQIELDDDDGTGTPDSNRSNVRLNNEEITCIFHLIFSQVLDWIIFL